MSSRAAREAEGSDWERTGRKTLSTITPTLNPTGRPPAGKPQKYKAVSDYQEEEEADDDEEEEYDFQPLDLVVQGEGPLLPPPGGADHTSPASGAHRLEHRLVRRLVRRPVRRPENPRVRRPVRRPDHRPVHRPDRLRAHLRRMTRSLCLLLLDLPLRRILRRFPLLPVHLRAWRMRCLLFPLPRRRVLPRTLRRAWRRDPGWSRWSPSVWFPCPCLINRRHPPRLRQVTSAPPIPNPNNPVRSAPPRSVAAAAFTRAAAPTVQKLVPAQHNPALKALVARFGPDPAAEGGGAAVEATAASEHGANEAIGARGKDWEGG